jgi:hypothetical protein
MPVTDTQTPNTPSPDEERFRRIRKVVGWLGIALPVLLILAPLGGAADKPTLSDYFHTPAREIFVGVLCAIGVFLFRYGGYPRNGENVFLSDAFVTRFASVCCLGVALFPNDGGSGSVTSAGLFLARMFGAADTAIPGLQAIAHFTSAIAFFVAIGVMCVVNFRRNDKPGKRDGPKTRRDAVFLGCGIVIFAAIVCAGVLFALDVEAGNAVFWLESLAVWAFGTAWLVKGRVQDDASVAIEAMKRKMA